MESFLMFGKYFKRHKFGLIDEMKKRVALHYSSLITRKQTSLGDLRSAVVWRIIFKSFHDIL